MQRARFPLRARQVRRPGFLGARLPALRRSLHRSDNSHGQEMKV